MGVYWVKLRGVARNFCSGKESELCGFGTEWDIHGMVQEMENWKWWRGNCATSHVRGRTVLQTPGPRNHHEFQGGIFIVFIS